MKNLFLAVILCAADTFRAVGGFNERLLSSGDVEWTRRAASAGHPLVYAPDTVVVHPPPADIATVPTPTPSPTPLPTSLVIQGVPFTIQSPYQVWDRVHNEYCEAAAVYMVGQYWNNDHRANLPQAQPIQKRCFRQARAPTGLRVHCLDAPIH